MATSKKSKKTNKKLQKHYGTISSIIGLLSTIFVVTLALIIKVNITGTISSQIDYSSETIPAIISNDKGEVIETTEYNGEEIKTVEEVDGGKFEDKDTGLTVNDTEYEDLGSAIEVFDTSSPEAFTAETLGKCIYANNRYGAQCVSLSRSFWISYANRDVSTCGTGMAKGMMNCAPQNAGDEFLIYWKDDAHQIQAGDWLVFDGGQYGHIGMALGGVHNGYVALLGENQGGRACEGGGAATNIINISIKNLIGFYRPKAYIKPTPTPTPEPTPTDKCKLREVVKGDTLGAIMLECRGEVVWGEAMNEYASKWYSAKYYVGQSVFTGWATKGVGLYAGDVIEYKD